LEKEIISSRSYIAAKSVQEKILHDRQVYTQEKKVKGPTIDLFFHELNDESPKMRRFLDLFLGSFLYLFYILINPIIYAYLKLSGVDTPYRKFKGVGQFGNIIEVKIYDIGYYQALDDEIFTNACTPKPFLYQTNLFKLPMVPQVLKGKLSLAGPQVLEENFALRLINNYTDFHKRFAPKPGVFSPSCYYSYEKSKSDFSTELKEDLSFAGRQTLKSYLSTL